MSEFTIRAAARSSIIPLIGFYGKSGGGKTLSALLVMRGLVGPAGKIAVLDTENRRAEIFADLVPGGYGVIDLDPPFGPDRYWDALQVAETADGIVVDSFSHEWAGEGGVLDMQEQELDRMAGDNWSKREACKYAAWIRPKMAHKRLVERLLRLKKPLIVCLRGEQKITMEKDDRGKPQFITNEFCSPISDPRFIFEMTIHAECYAKPNAAGHAIGGYLRITKITHHAVIDLLPGATEQVGIKHGQALAAWCAGGTTEPAKQIQTDTNPMANELKRLKAELWKLTAKQHGGIQKHLEQWLWDEGLIDVTETLAGLSAERLAQVIQKIQGRSA